VKTNLTLPTIFISHGGGPWPLMKFTDVNPYDGLSRYLRGIPNSLGTTPKAILVISAHWEESEFTVMTNPRPSMLYDYYGFPPETYQVKYSAPGSTELSARVRELLTKADIQSREDRQRGFDHGVFVPLMVSFPEAKIPVVALSMKKGLDPATHIRMGEALIPLRREGVLVLGSGLSYHNLRRFNSEGGSASRAFDKWLTEAVLMEDPKLRNERLLEWSKAPSAREAHPREDHLLPLMVAAGAAGNDLGVKAYSDHFNGLEISGFQFGL